MIDKVLYRCSRCGHTYLDAGDGAITPKGKRVDGVVPVCAECFISNVTREPALMVQVWPKADRIVELELLSVCERLLATVGSGSDLDWHLRNEGYADELRNVVNRAKAAGLG